ncbi:hypothetical protein MML48_1g02418 [Holotrichia oblita]|nr:hypothetical protein MML48_1g02418 [Holotrichia oblita]
MCDAFYRFTLVDIGAPGRFSDGGVFRDSLIGKKFESFDMDLPPPHRIGNIGFLLPYVFVADEAFALTSYSMRPYPGKNLNSNKIIFNYRLSRARRVIENTFGIMAARWRIYRKPIIASNKKIIKIIQATVCLHNYLMEKDRHSDMCYFSLDKDLLELPTTGILPLQNVGSNNYTREAAVIRDNFANYFHGEGAVPWQWQNVGHH